MLDVFIDMTNTAKGTLGNPLGGRCAMGSVLWTMGVPHDRLLSLKSWGELTQEDRFFSMRHAPELHTIAGMMYSFYDNMIETLAGREWRKAHLLAIGLINTGRRVGVNFIITSPLPKHSSKPKELAHA